MAAKPLFGVPDSCLALREGRHHREERMRKLAYAFLISMLFAAPANAACYQDLGCTDEDEFSEDDLEDLSCSSLWELRNVIYFDHGYCFKTNRAINHFGNDECEIDDAEDIEFSEIEQQNINTIVSIEDDKGC
jgi:hypothetical protein